MSLCNREFRKTTCMRSARSAPPLRSKTTGLASVSAWRGVHRLSARHELLHLGLDEEVTGNYLVWAQSCDPPRWRHGDLRLPGWRAKVPTCEMPLRKKTGPGSMRKHLNATKCELYSWPRETAEEGSVCLRPEGIAFMTRLSEVDCPLYLGDPICRSS